MSQPNNLPFQLSSFIGREREMGQVQELLARHRLVTLTGPGGCGKTRLALEVAAAQQAAARSEDGVWLVELAALSDPLLTPQAVASSLGLRDLPERRLIDNLIDYLHPRSPLLVLDNCEHLLPACATLVQKLLSTCPRLHILATSRETLGITGESIWVIPPLAWPDPHSLPPLESLAQYDAIQLFVDRARASSPAFSLTNQNAPTIAQICQHLDGIPLALELAAARIKVLSVEQIASRLDDCFHLLTGGSRTALPRHHTLRAALDWSYELLSEAQGRLFGRLSVFVGGFNLEAVETICGAEGLAQEDVLDLLADLVDKSLVTVVQPEETARYRLLEPIRQYAREKLRGSSEAGVIQDRHVRFYVDLAEAAEPNLRGGHRATWMRRLEAEYSNFRTALIWLTDHQEIEAAMQLAGALAWFWYFRGYTSEALDWCERLLAAPDEGKAGAARAKVLWAAGASAWVLGDHATARAHLSEGRKVCQTIKSNDRSILAYILALLGLLTGLQGNHTSARQLQEEAIKLFKDIEDRWGLALAYYWQGDTLRMQRDYAAACSLFEESHILFNKICDQWGQGLALQGLGAAMYQQGDYTAAQARFTEALSLRRVAGDKWLLAQTLASLGTLGQQQADYEQAMTCFEESLALHREVGDKRGLGYVLRHLGEVEQQRGNNDRATACFMESLSLARELGHPQRVAKCLKRLAHIFKTQRPEQATQLLDVATRLRDSPDSAPVAEQIIDHILSRLDWPGTPLSPKKATALTPSQSTQVEVQAGPELDILALGPEQVYRAGTLLTSSDWTYAKVKELLFYLLEH